MGTLGDSSVGIWTFIPSPHPTDKCGTNGLPLTPNSIVVMGKFEVLKTLYHENICQYLDIVRAKHERLIIAEEHHENNLYKMMKDGKQFSNEELTRIMFDIVQGLAFLNKQGIVSRNVSPMNIAMDSKGKAKHSKFGLYHMTANGSLVAFPIGSPKYMAPEVIGSGPGLSPVYGPSSHKVDVWSVGMVLLNLILGGTLWQDVEECNEVQKIFEKIMSLVNQQKETYEHCLNILINDNKSPEKLQNLKPELISILKACLTIKPSERPSATDLLDHELFNSFDKNKVTLENGIQPFPSTKRSVGIELSDLRNEANKQYDENEDHLAYRYRVQRSFFSPQSTAQMTCLSCRDLIHWFYCCSSLPEQSTANRPLTLDDLAKTKPEYLCNVTANNWKKDAKDGNDFEILTLSSKAIERIDRGREEKEFGNEGFLKPRDVELSTAMLTSSAFLSYELGNLQGSTKPFRELRIIFGLGFGASIVSQPNLTMTSYAKVLPLCLQLFFALSTTIIPVLYYYWRIYLFEIVGSLLFVSIMLVLMLISIIPTGAVNPGLMERFARPLIEVYHLWCLAGGDMEGELKRQGLIKTKAPILSLPNVFLNTGVEMGAEKDKILLLDETTISLSLSQLRERLQHVGLCSYYPLIEENDPASRSAMLDIAELPLVIRERTVDYQFHRIVLFQRLLLGYPYTRDRLVREARTDIPPFLRGKIWAALLGVQGDTQGTYDSVDKESPSNADRQIEVDIPRCHQYDPLLSSPTAHEKFKRVLKAWVVSHPNLGYWQGLDSLCAPFLSQHFNDEALAYSCMSAFIPKYLYNFFLKDNAPIIQEYLAVFSQLIAFHDPELFTHMQNIGFIPELYSIPWFLTMFCHVFPLHKIYHLWDTLLLGNSSFPLCIGVAILQQLRDQLLSFGFNECILLFSDMPGIDIDRVVRDSKKIFSWTPRTASLRRHEYAVATSKGKSEKDFLPLKHLKEEVCPRITAQDLIHIMELGNNIQSWTTGSPKNNAKPRGIVVDVRSPEEFHRGRVPGSVNIPFNQAFLEDGALAESTASNTLSKFRGKIVIIMGNKTNYPAKIGAELVKLSFRRVCVLEEPGIGVLRSQAILTVQT